MTILIVKHRALTAQIKSIRSELAVIESNPAFKREQDFADKLEGLMKEYGKQIQDIVSMLDPDARLLDENKPSRGPVPGTPRKRVNYVNPHTNESVVTASGNNTILKAWKAKYPNENIKGWIVGDSNE